MLPLPLDYVNRLYHGELAPVGIDDKVWSESHDGSRRVKYRLTHDQSFETSIGRSVNGRLRRDALPPLSYGGRFSRVVHYVVSLRLIGKFDFKAAYRRVSLHGDISEKCTIMYNQFSLPSLRLTFSRSPCPHEFCFFSEMCADLANDLLHCKDWDADTLQSPHAPLMPEPLLFPDKIPFAPA